MAAGLLAAAVWGGGFVWFIRVAERPADLPPVADGVVALTGGAERVEAALRLLAEDRAGNLLISGIGGGVDLATLAHRAGVDPAPLVQRVTLGRSATSTRGNAQETAVWAHTHHIGTLIVVTAFYHMPRALLELGRDMPGAHLYPAPVMPGRLWQRPASAVRLLAGEYAKYLLAATWLSRLGRSTT